MFLSWMYNQDIVRATTRSLQLDTMPALAARRRIPRLPVPWYTPSQHRRMQLGYFGDRRLYDPTN